MAAPAGTGAATAAKNRVSTTLTKIDPASFPYPDAASSGSSGSPGAFTSHLNLDLASPDHPLNLTTNPPTSTYAQDLAALQLAKSILSATPNDPRPPLVAFPTETVYGLGANALSATAVPHIFRAKGRPSDNPLIVHVSSLDMLRSLLPPSTDIPDVYLPILAAHWPGPLTILVPRGPNVPDTVTAGQPSLAVRMPRSPVARALIDLCGFPIAAPSANTSGRPSPTLASHVRDDLDGAVALILDGGPAVGGVESTVLDGLSSPPAVLRPGGVTVEMLAALPGMETLRVYKRDFVDEGMEKNPVTPGMKYRHYSPEVEVVLLEERTGAGEPGDHGGRMRAAVLAEANRLLAVGEKDGRSSRAVGILRTTRVEGVERSGGDEIKEEPPGVLNYNMGDRTDPASVAHSLFNGLRTLESRGVMAILVEGISEEREGMAVMNRLRKAASRTIAV
ncbi:hypothetical protein HK101_003324 [Irineochytrium annulatum]|nr:hypothetical protein HK101_003324 [Irineochytrium annulatum]